MHSWLADAAPTPAVAGGVLLAVVCGAAVVLAVGITLLVVLLRRRK
jgi:uncharacterized protein (TIGR03382 family)